MDDNHRVRTFFEVTKCIELDERPYIIKCVGLYTPSHGPHITPKLQRDVPDCGSKYQLQPRNKSQ